MYEFKGDTKEIRQSWKKGSTVEVLSKTLGKWFLGTIKEIEVDEEGEWLMINYAKNRSKETQRFYEDIRPARLKQTPDSPEAEEEDNMASLEEKLQRITNEANEYLGDE